MHVESCHYKKLHHGYHFFGIETTRRDQLFHDFKQFTKVLSQPESWRICDGNLPYRLQMTTTVRKYNHGTASVSMQLYTDVEDLITVCMCVCIHVSLVH